MLMLRNKRRSWEKTKPFIISGRTDLTVEEMLLRQADH